MVVSQYFMHVDFQTKNFDLRIIKGEKSPVHVGSREVFMNLLWIRGVVTVMS